MAIGFPAIFSRRIGVSVMPYTRLVPTTSCSRRQVPERHSLGWLQLVIRVSSPIRGSEEDNITHLVIGALSLFHV